MCVCVCNRNYCDYPRRDDDDEDDVSDEVGEAERRGDDGVAVRGGRSALVEVDERNNGVPHAHHYHDRHRRYDVHVLHARAHTGPGCR